MGGQGDHEARTGTLGTWVCLLHRDAAAVRLGDGTHDREAQAERATAVADATNEALEQRFGQALGDAGAVVLND